MFTRLFGNKKSLNKPWGTKEENGIGKFSDFTETALKAIKELGVTHIWFTGVPQHALIGDYSDYGIENDHPAVVKGRAGSPYAVKDYYSVNPDLADDPEKRVSEFEALIKRTHNQNLQVIIDIVPNHVARQCIGFGENDDTSLEYHRDNNFYYIPNKAFSLPDIPPQFKPLIEEQQSESYIEFPAKWTGNGSRLAKPSFDDWYETVKVNYGIKPDGSKDFPILPLAYANKSNQDHFAFWADKPVPNSWIKFRDIALYWLEKGVDGFRYDMAEMVPIEFWSYMNSAIKAKKQNAFLLAEVYTPELYRDYIQLGKMDYLYDKVDLYDSLKGVMQGNTSTKEIARIQNELCDIEHHMLHFLDNHDEQRIVSPEFIGNADLARPAMLLSATLSSSPTMIYFGQEVGEAGSEDAGFGQPSRTSIFDYVGVPQHQKWMNGGKFDGALLSEEEQSLRNFYQKVLNFSLDTPALTGDYVDLYNLNQDNFGPAKNVCFVFSRKNKEQTVIVAINFSASATYPITLTLPCSKLGLCNGQYTLTECISSAITLDFTVKNNDAKVDLLLPPLASFAYILTEKINA